MKFYRTFSMPSSETFSMMPVQAFLSRYVLLNQSQTIVDPFARNNTWATYTNDLDPNTKARWHVDAEKFCLGLAHHAVVCDVGIFDPPYSPRQIFECYKSVGLEVGREETQNGRLYKRVRDAMDRLIKPGGVVLSFGWSSNGMGKGRGYEIEEIVLVAHGGAHNDTICLAERKT